MRILVNRSKISQLEVEREEKKELHQTTKKLLKLQVEEFTLNEADSMVLWLSKWELVQKLFVYIKPHLKQYSPLSPFQQLLVTLMRLRLNLGGANLCYRFSVHESTISRTFEFVIGFMPRFKPLMMWPDRDTLQKTMPMVFHKHYPRCVVIIHCFEIFLERPTNLLARAQTFSSYKHHNTVQYLSGITPQGTVSNNYQTDRVAGPVYYRTFLSTKQSCVWQYNIGR